MPTLNSSVISLLASGLSRSAYDVRNSFLLTDFPFRLKYSYNARYRKTYWSYKKSENNKHESISCIIYNIVNRASKGTWENNRGANRCVWGVRIRSWPVTPSVNHFLWSGKQSSKIRYTTSSLALCMKDARKHAIQRRADLADKVIITNIDFAKHWRSGRLYIEHRRTFIQISNQMVKMNTRQVIM